MKLTFVFLTCLISLPALATTACTVEAFAKSTEGQEKLTGLVELSKGLIISKLEELGIEENQVEIKAVYPKLDIVIKAKNLNAEGSLFTMKQVTREEDCGIEISIVGGHVLNKENGKDFGSLGNIKEFVRLN